MAGKEDTRDAYTENLGLGDVHPDGDAPEAHQVYQIQLTEEWG